MPSQQGPEQAAMTGATVGHYRFHEMIGRGGMGEVYRAHDERLDRSVAIKVLPERLAANDNARRRFIRETNIASKIIHPYVATVFDIVEERDKLFLVMEYIEGRPLSTILREEQPSVPQALEWAREAAEGLTTIHKSGLVHRDLKPGNLMITPDNHVKLMDFGLAREIVPPESEDSKGETPTREPSITQDGTGVGTVIYMSPEQLHGAKADQRSDLFSFGVLMYETLTGIHPFVRQTVHESVSAIMNEAPGPGQEPPSLTESGPVRDVVLRLLDKHPENRYQSGEQLLEDLRALSQSASFLPGLGAWRAKRYTRIALILAVPLLVTVAAGYNWITRPPTWSKPRISIAVAPLRDSTGEEDGHLRASMVADLLANDLESSRLVRAVGPAQTSELIKGMPADSTTDDIARTVAVRTLVDYVLTGTLYKEGDQYLATVDVISAGGTLPEMTGVRATGKSLLALSERLATNLRRELPEVSALTAWRDDSTELDEMTSDSEEARMLYERGLLAQRDGKLGEAIGYFEQAVEVDDQFPIAYARLAETLHAAQYGRRAREAATRAVELASDVDTPAAERLALSIRAIRAEVYGHNEEAREATGRLAMLYSDEPQLLALDARQLQLGGKFDTALARIDEAIRLDPACAALHQRRGEILVRAGRVDEAYPVLDEAERLFELYGSLEGIAGTAYLRGQGFFKQERFEEVPAELLRAIDGLSEAGSEVLAAKAALQLAEMHILQGQVQTAAEPLNRAFEMAESVGAVGLRCRAFSTRGARLFMMGDYEASDSSMREAIDLARQLENDQLLITPLTNLASMKAYTGQLEDARPLLQETSRVAKEIGSKNAEMSALLNLSEIDYQMGKLDEALGSYRAMLADEVEGEKLQRMTIFAHMQIAEIQDRRGYLAEALSAADMAVEKSRALGLNSTLSDALARRIRILAALGRGEQAVEGLEETRRLSEAVGSEQAWMTVRTSLAQSAMALHDGDYAAALQAAERVPSLPGGDLPVAWTTSRLYACEALMELDRIDEALALCRSGFSHKDAPLSEKVIAKSVLADALSRAGLHGDAREMALDVLERAKAMGLLLAQARAAGVLLALPEASRPENIEEIKSQGRKALESYIEAVPETDRESVRVRSDIQKLYSVL
jgi:serine/threonine protein kinase/tetratricopeptide (TPR) repeat protein